MIQQRDITGNAAGDADAILTVHASSVEGYRQAAEILDRNGAVILIHSRVAADSTEI